MTVANSQPIEWQISPFGLALTGAQAISWALSTSDTAIEVILDGAPTGLVGTLTVSVITFDGSVPVVFPTTNDIAEVPPGSGRYSATVARPNIGHYWVVWTDGTTTATTELLIVPDNQIQTPLSMGPFSAYRIKAGDTQPSLILTLRNAGGAPLDLNGVLGVNVAVRRKGDLLPVASRDALIIDPLESGQVVLDWNDGETDAPGVYEAEASILWPGNGRSTAPSKATYRFVVEERGI